MKLYYLPGACPLATHIVLKWIGRPCEFQAVSRTEIKEAAFLALNPVGSVPVLVDGDFVLTQSSAILEYLTEASPQAGLHGRDAKERAQVRRWLGFCNSDLHRTFSLIFSAPSYTDDPGFQQQLIDKTTERLIALFRVVDRQLAGKDWLTGSRSIADPYLYTILRWARAKKLDLSEFGNLQAFFSRMDTDAGVREALTEQGLA